MMNSWLILTALLATTALAQDVIPVPTCRSQHVHYNRTTGNSCVVSCNDVPIENFCIPAQANSMESLIIDLTACDTQTMDWIPTGLFQEDNQIRRLSVYAPSSYTRFIQSLKSDTFENLKGLEELTLEGFERIRYLSPDVFRPLVKLKKLRLIGFGGQFLTYRQLGDALFGLSNSSLEEITMDSVHTGVNPEKTLDMNNLLRISGVNITSLVLINNDFKFQNESLRSLDVSGSEISFIPKSMFSELSALQFLSLSRNTIESFQVKLPPSGNLSLLNLSDNSIRFLTSEMISELESLQNSDDNGTKLTIDLSRNPLSCLCNATDFVAWMKSTKKVSFESIEEYTCLHPNGSKVSVNSLNMTELMSDCKSLGPLLILLPTICPCDGLDYKRLRQLSLFLTDVYCSYYGKRYSYADLVTNVNKIIEEYWWCKRVTENPIYKRPKFIVLLVIEFLLLLLLGVGLIVFYKKRYTPYRMLQCMDLRLYIMHFIRYLSNHPAYTSDNFELDTFVYFQADDGPWVRKVLLKKLQHVKVITPDNFCIGASMADAISDGCKKSRVIVLVLSSSFKRGIWCRQVTLRSYTSHPGSVIPVVINNTDLSDFEDDPLFSNLIATHCPIDLSSADSLIWNEFTTRLQNTN